MRIFVLKRKEDPSGISGTGVVAEGVEFHDGSVALRWIKGDHHSTVIHQNMQSMAAIHAPTHTTEIVYGPVEVYHDEHTHGKAYDAIFKAGVPDYRTLEILEALDRAGILLKERTDRW